MKKWQTGSQNNEKYCELKEKNTKRFQDKSTKFIVNVTKTGFGNSYTVYTFRRFINDPERVAKIKDVDTGHIEKLKVI